ncbi:predicted protein [Histoplasma capsulatum H143]|uniref:Uncharacterized protein n=1 Tax=Ajellomyces capsulatus (strain H143) TaxID=544712 RepID=C6HTA9_AJECH|nr:predicted protein [Histoplasma capsulatum H143]
MTKWQERPAEKHPDWEQPEGAPRQPCRQALANQRSLVGAIDTKAKQGSTLTNIENGPSAVSRRKAFKPHNPSPKKRLRASLSPPSRLYVRVQERGMPEPNLFLQSPVSRN